MFGSFFSSVHSLMINQRGTGSASKRGQIAILVGGMSRVLPKRVSSSHHQSGLDSFVLYSARLVDTSSMMI